MKQQYTVHRYQVENDKYEWKNILNTVINETGTIFHLDYSENLQGTPKFEPQSAHFSKKQYIHCTVSHVNTNDKENYEYLYHLSNDTKHDSAQILGIIHNIISTYGNMNV